MSNLFSVFEPKALFSLPLNWLSSLTAMVTIPAVFFMAPSFAMQMLSSFLNYLQSEFKAILSPFSVPGMLLIPLSLFLFIMLNNFLGLFPFIFTSSSHLTFTIAMALPLWVGHMTVSALNTPASMLAHLVPLGTPAPLMPFMVVIELISNLIRPLTLSVRLAANMIAGHLLLSLLGSLTPTASYPILSIVMIAIVLLGGLEIAVSLIQAYVFSVLSTLYLNEVNSPHLS